MNLLMIVLGGLVGGFFRYVLETVIPTPMSLPLGTFVINMLGSFLLGFIYQMADERAWKSWVRLALGTGMMGAFTTFSTFSLELSELMHLHYDWVLAYGLVSIIGGVICVMLGEWAAKLMLRKTVQAEEVYS